MSILIILSFLNEYTFSDAATMCFQFGIFTVTCFIKVWFVVFNVPSTARSFRDGTPIYCPLRKT